MSFPRPLQFTLTKVGVSVNCSGNLSLCHCELAEGKRGNLYFQTNNFFLKEGLLKPFVV
jgi:hypothetical protein